ncbi:carbohydrate ABC transporter permease [Streptomyces echinatus]|uniref:carbohydrate ABC transporter permease n=1 Tax=Streptomyces echinatus TaxID=67293 RepID=UPI003CD0B9C2
MIYWMAALQNVPDELYEAAALDGASEWQKLTRITLPMIRPVAVVIVMLAPGQRDACVRARRHPHRWWPGHQHLRGLVLHLPAGIRLAALRLRIRLGCRACSSPSWHSSS